MKYEFYNIKSGLDKNGLKTHLIALN